MKALDPAALDCLAALADDTSFERAAQRLSITQSAVSQRLRALEAQVGQPLVLRTRPLRLTEPGKVLLRYARQLQAMRADVARELGVSTSGVERLAIAVNADSLATWVPAALDPLVQRGVSLELIVDDQDFTHDGLRQGAVLGCVSTVREALRGCRVVRLGTMRYTAAASPAFVERELGGTPAGLNRANFSRLPFLVFNRKDDMQHQWSAVRSGCARHACTNASCRRQRPTCAPCAWAGASGSCRWCKQARCLRAASWWRCGPTCCSASSSTGISGSSGRTARRRHRERPCSMKSVRH